MFASQGIAMALLARERTGRGQHVDVGMLDATAALLTYQAANLLRDRRAPGADGQPAPDDRAVRDVRRQRRRVRGRRRQRRAVAARSAARAVSRRSAEDPRFATNPQRVDAYDELRPVIAGRLATRTRAEWIEALNAAGVPCGSVRDVGEVLQDPQIAAREMIERVEHATLGAVRVLGVPVKLSDTPGSVRSAPPALGQHTEAILRNDLGFSAAEIAAMRSAGAI